jgi:sulfate transport system permease protein
MRPTHRVLPGFGLSMGYTVMYLSFLVLLPLSTLVWKTQSMGMARFLEVAFEPRAIAAYKLTFGASLAAALVNTVFGFLIAWVLVRYQFFGRRFIDALVDLPFALPTAVGGIALTTLYSDQNGLLGKPLAALGIKAMNAPLGIVIALTFISLPFVVRTVQPVLGEMQHDWEEAAVLLGAGRWQTFRRVIFPHVAPALLTGSALAFARAIGEYGSVVFISGNLPGKTEILSQLIITRIEENDFPAATAIASVMLAASFLLLLAINALQVWSARRTSA